MNVQSSPTCQRRWFLVFVVIALVCVAGIYFLRSHKSRPSAKADVTTVHSNALPSLVAVTNVAAGNTNTTTTAQDVGLPAPLISSTNLHPFKAALTNGDYEWTAEDGMDTNVIRRLAHNELEYKRMVNENSTIYRRQLVYLKESPAAVFEQAELTGKPLQNLTLPGLDGQLLPVVVTRTDLKDGGNQGQVYGQLPGQPGSMVTMAFVGDREAFTLISHQDNTYLQAESHDPGQIVVKSINPNIYGVITR